MLGENVKIGEHWLVTEMIDHPDGREYPTTASPASAAALRFDSQPSPTRIATTCEPGAADGRGDSHLSER